MKVIVYTQRVEYVSSYGERRDCTDQSIPKLLLACGFLPIPIYNIPNRDLIEQFMNNVSVGGVLFTGGNSLYKYGGDALERDKTEIILLEWCLKKNIPVLGLCRGMQFILDYFGAELKNIDGHVAVRHKIEGIIDRNSVNSFHRQAARRVPQSLVVMSRALDGVVEAIKHKKKAIYGIMWHPERDNPFYDDDIELIKSVFEGVE